MGDAIKITWRVDDGYAGGDRPQISSFRPEELDLDVTDEELADQIQEIVSDDFDNKIAIDIRTADINAAVKAVRAATSTTVT
jgi:hypothetical protein